MFKKRTSHQIWCINSYIFLKIGMVKTQENNWTDIVVILTKIVDRYHIPMVNIWLPFRQQHQLLSNRRTNFAIDRYISRLSATNIKQIKKVRSC